jgi:hypothetical protein
MNSCLKTNCITSIHVANWYQDLGWVDTACPEVVSRPSLWSVLVTTYLIVFNVRPNLLSPCQSYVSFYVMDRILKRPASSEPLSPVSSPCKKPILNAKQGDVSALFQGQELGANFYESGGKLFCRPCNAVVVHHWETDVKAHTNSPGVTAVPRSPLRVGLMVVV